MSQMTLHPSSYIVLGLVERLGEATPYDMKAWADESIGYFWTFSRASLYKEPARLKTLGLLDERQENTGRRRRLYSITASGKTALANWLDTQEPATAEIRDLGLLKLYFAQSGTQAAFEALVKDQVKAHAERLETYKALKSELASNEDWRFYTAALEMGLKYEEMSISFWEDIAAKKLDVDQ